MKNEKSELLIMLLYEHFPYSRWVSPFCNRVYAVLTKVKLNFREKLKKNRVICDGLSSCLRGVAILDDVITLYVLILNVAFQTVVPWNSMIDPVLVE